MADTTAGLGFLKLYGGGRTDFGVEPGKVWGQVEVTAPHCFLEENKEDGLDGRHEGSFKY